MTEETELSEEGRLLAEAFGLALGSFSKALQIKGVLHAGDLNTALSNGMRAIRSRQDLPGSPRMRDAVADAIDRMARI